jgi:surfeit locus 1 family protein
MAHWLRPLINRRWRWPTVVVILGIALLVRLGIWQLDRLEERRASNAVLAAQLAQPPVTLTGQESTPDLLAMKDRTVAAAGQFDYTHQFIIQLQPWQGQTGVNLVTPLLLDDNTAILVDQGWIPEAEVAVLEQFHTSGPTTVTGYVELSQVARYGERDITDTTFKAEQYRIDIEVMQAQLPYTLLPVYIQQAPTEDEPGPPYRAAQEIDLSEGPHLSYALQWFSFALLLAGGYLYYVQQQEKKPRE